MHDSYPAIEQLDNVSRTHAEAYIQQLRERGRHIRKITCQRDYQGKTVAHSYNAQSQLSGRTVNAFHKILKSVFAKLQEDAGILYNPFDFDMMDNDSESRDAFTPAELNLISDNLTFRPSVIYCRHLYRAIRRGYLHTAVGRHSKWTLDCTKTAQDRSRVGNPDSAAAGQFFARPEVDCLRTASTF